MSIEELKQGPIKRKAHIPDKDRTPEKDRAAEWLESGIIEKKRWPQHVVDMEAESDWSRQHLTGVLHDYFTRNHEEENGDERYENSDEIPRDVYKAVYREVYSEAYRQGFLDGRESVLDS